MIRYLTLEEVLDLHCQVIAASGGRPGVRDQGLLESALAQPRMAFAGVGVYPTLAQKAAALGYSIIQNHPFLDGNKRVGHAALETFLVLNGWELSCDASEQERIILAVASGAQNREDFSAWIVRHAKRRESSP